jgi:hypothetical protein
MSLYKEILKKGSVLDQMRDRRIEKEKAEGFQRDIWGRPILPNKKPKKKL